MAEQLLTASLFPDEVLGSPAAIRASGASRPPRARTEKTGSNKQSLDSRQITLAEAGWPAPERFPHNARGETVQAVVDTDLLASRNPLIVTGFVGLDSLLGLLASLRPSTESVRVLLGHEPYAAGKTVFRVGRERFADEIADYWLERGVSLYLSGEVLKAIDLLENGRIDARISGESGVVHAKMYCTEVAATLGSSNYSRGGLISQIEGNTRFTADAEPERFQETVAFAERVWEEGKDYTDGLHELLQQLLSAVTWQEALGRACAELLEGRWARTYEPLLPTEARQLWPSQVQGLAQAMWVLEHVGSVLVADATGSGKTRLGAHLISAALHRLVWGSGRTRREMLPVLVCPSVVTDLWTQAREECGFAAETYSDGLLSRGRPEKQEAIERTLRRAQVLAMDEAHRFMNRASARTRRILFNNLADFVLLFTATPVNRGPRDLVAIVDLLGADNFDDDVLDVLGRLTHRRDPNEAIAPSERALLQAAIQRFTVRRTKSQFNALIAADPDSYRDVDENPCRFPDHRVHSYPCGETPGDRELARRITELTGQLLGVALLQGELALTSAQRADLLRRGGTEQQYLDWRLLGARGLAAHNVRSALRSSRAALVEHLRGTQAACRRFGIQPPKEASTGDVIGTLERLAQLGPPSMRLDAQPPEWLRDSGAYAEACERERGVYLEIEGLAAELSDAREKAKADLLLKLGKQHSIVLAFDSVLVTLAEFQRRLRSVTEREVVLATGSDTAGRKRVIRAAARGATPSKRVIALCSDTMSEGLNLQGASAVVHLDMPSVIRVAEQRAGRVDRLDSPHPYVDIWWPQDAAEFALRQDERFYARYEFVADVLGSNFSVPQLDGAPVRVEEMVEAVVEHQGSAAPWDGVADAFQPVRELVSGPQSLVPAPVYAQIRSSRAHVISSVSAVEADHPWAFFAVTGTEWGAPQWIYFAGPNETPTTDLKAIAERLTQQLSGREPRNWDEMASAAQNAFLRELARREPELLPRKKRRALEELEWVVGRYRARAVAERDEVRLEVTRQVLGLLHPFDAEERADEAQRRLFERSAVDLHSLADSWLDTIRPTWYAHLRDHHRARPLRLRDLRKALTGGQPLTTAQLQEIVANGRIVRPVDERVVATIVGVSEKVATLERQWVTPQ